MDGIVKNLSFGDEAKQKVFKGIDKLTKAVSSTLGASGKCVIMEDNSGVPIITKDGVTVANSVILRDPVENMGATLLKEAARKTVREAGDGTTTATVLAHSIMNSAKSSDRKVRDGISSGVDKVIDYLKSISIPAFKYINLKSFNLSSLCIRISINFSLKYTYAVKSMSEIKCV